MKTLIILIVCAGIAGGAKWIEIGQKLDAEHATLVESLDTISKQAMNEGPYPANKQLTASIESMGGTVEQIDLKISPQRDSVSLTASYSRPQSLWGIYSQKRVFSLNNDKSAPKEKSNVGKMFSSANKTVDAANKNTAEKTENIESAFKE